MKTQKTKNPIVIAIDFDGTLCRLYPNKKGYVPKKEIKQIPNTNMVELCRYYKQVYGAKIVIHSSRWWGEYNVIKNWLEKHCIPYDDIILGKFKADVYIDDLAINPIIDDNLNSRLVKIVGAKNLQKQKEGK